MREGTREEVRSEIAKEVGIANGGVRDGCGIEKRSRNTEEWMETTLLWKRKAMFCAITTMFPSSNQISVWRWRSEGKAVEVDIVELEPVELSAWIMVRSPLR